MQLGRSYSLRLSSRNSSDICRRERREKEGEGGRGGRRRERERGVILVVSAYIHVHRYCTYMMKRLRNILENCEKPAATRD